MRYTIHMNLKFEYNKDKDIWCLLNKGKSSINSQLPTKTYEKLIEFAGENPNEVKTSEFIEIYLKENNLDILNFIENTKKDFEKISGEFINRAEDIFGLNLEKEIKVFVTINERCPYNTKENWFLVSVSKENPVSTIVHELWHFYTWEKFGDEYLNKIGSEKYNIIKESITVILNLEFGDMLPEKDFGYPNHQELREKISLWWQEKKDIKYVFDKSVDWLSDPTREHR